MKIQKLAKALCAALLFMIVALFAAQDVRVAGWRWTWAWPNRWRVDSGPVSEHTPTGDRIAVGRYYRCGPVFIEYHESARM